MSRQRVVIENVTPRVSGGRYPVKRIIGESIRVEADVFADGHDRIAVRLLWQASGASSWNESVMLPLGNDRWAGEFLPSSTGLWLYSIRGWVDHPGTARDDIMKKWEAGQDVGVEILTLLPMIKRMAVTAHKSGSADAELLDAWIGLLSSAPAALPDCIEVLSSPRFEIMSERYPHDDNATRYHHDFPVRVERTRALVGAWYELFPRSACASENGVETCGTFDAVRKLLPDIRSLGFDVVYLPPIHPVGRTKRKGRNNAVEAQEGDPGSPWAVGNESGGHTAVDPALGTLDDFVLLVEQARELELEIALDIAFQCSPDHPWVREHPLWFRFRADGTVQYAENPPKKYEDIIPINFETEDWEHLWRELLGVFLFWIGKGIRIFRVDNPHTKPFPFWDWIIREITALHPDTIFLAEAFTRPRVMYRLAKLGFTQSYTYFTWRNTKHEIEAYMRELTRSGAAEFFRPNFWPNTPDILPEYLQIGGRPAFIVRFILAATLSPSYGIYGPAYELCVNGALPGREEYLDSEKFEARKWNRESPGNIRDLIRKVNAIRRESSALRTLRNVEFGRTDDESVLIYRRYSDDEAEVLFVAVNLDPFHAHEARVELPSTGDAEGGNTPFIMHELLSDEREFWSGARGVVSLDPERNPAGIYRLRRYIRRENDFDYYM